MNFISARLYVSTRTRPLTADEAETKRIAYALKDPLYQAEVFTIAGAEMARLISGHCVLVPVPNRSGSCVANERLCKAIAMFVPDCKIYSVLDRRETVSSQCERHKKGIGPLSVMQHQIIRLRQDRLSMPVYLVDNVTTSGNTLEACNHWFSYLAIGLVWADASRTMSWVDRNK